MKNKIFITRIIEITLDDISSIVKGYYEEYEIFWESLPEEKKKELFSIMEKYAEQVIDNHMVFTESCIIEVVHMAWRGTPIEKIKELFIDE